MPRNKLKRKMNKSLKRQNRKSTSQLQQGKEKQKKESKVRELTFKGILTLNMIKNLVESGNKLKRRKKSFEINSRKFKID